MLDEIKTKIRALTEDIGKSDFETFTYTASSIFTLAEENINEITKVLKNGVELGSGEYSFDSTTNKITITASLTSGNEIEVDYTYYKYSSTELTEYVRASLVWISIFAYKEGEKDFEIETDEIYPTPENKDADLIALVSSILINPDYTSYRLPNLTVNYNNKLTKEEKIERLVNKFKMGVGVSDVLQFN